MALEDYTTYAEVDPNGRYAVTTNKVTVTGLTRNEDAYITSDKGVNHFGSTYSHTLDAQVTADNDTAVMGVWCLANVIDDIFGIQSDGSETAHILFFNVSATVRRIRLREINGGSFFTDEFSAYSLSTRYYFTTERIAGGTYGVIQVKIYSDAGRTTLIDTLTLTLHADHEFRYVYAVQPFNLAAAGVISGDIQNLNLNEAAIVGGGFPFFFDAGHY